MFTPLKSALQSRKLVRVFALGQLCHPKLVELVGLLGGYDAIWFDQEHVGLTIPQIEDATRAARAAGIDTFVRLAATDYATVMRVLEAGAGGIMAAMIRNVGEVRDLVRWAKFHPEGERGVNGAGIDAQHGLMPFQDYLRHANARTTLGVQIEHIDAVECVEEILQVKGIDYLFIGPADLSQSMGIPGEWDHPRFWQAIERVAWRCKETAMPWATLPLNLDFARRCVGLGCQMLSIGLDVWAIVRGVKAVQNEFAEFFQL